jgi:uncharacterized surface protein with fasciclin (FAS1) repeats
MDKNDLRLLVSIEDRIIAEDIQNLLEESEIYTMLISDNPAYSILSTYTGLNPAESIGIQINKEDYQRAIEILNDSPFKELVDSTTLNQPENEKPFEG